MFKFKLGYVEEQSFATVFMNFNKNWSFIVDVQQNFMKLLNHVSGNVTRSFKAKLKYYKWFKNKKYKNIAFKKLNTIKHQYKNLIYMYIYMHYFQGEKSHRCIQNPVKHLQRKFLAKIVSDIQPLTIFAKNSILDVRLGYKYASEFTYPCKTFSKYLNNV